MYRILIVEDDSTIASNVAAHLERWDYETKQIEDFKCVMEAFQQFDPQLVILDIGLPFYNGFYWCQEIRKISSVPILFLSSMNDNMNIVMAMNMGGDEFIEKPFDLNVLTAKVQALLRRAYSFQGNVNVLEHEGINCSGILQQIQKWEEEQRYILQKCKVRAESVRYFDGSSGTFFL